MSRENTVHDFDDHDLRGIVRASRFSYIGGMLGVFFDGEFNRESSVIAVKLSVKKDSLITPIGKKHRARVLRTCHRRILFFLYRKNGNSVGWTCGWEKVHERW